MFSPKLANGGMEKVQGENEYSISYGIQDTKGTMT